MAEKKGQRDREAIANFKIYARGVERLNELEKELNSLKTRKFRKEEEAIRKKLKNVSKIPEIEENIRRLRLKIAGVDAEVLESKIDKKQERQIKNLQVEGRILERKVKRAKELTKDEIENVEKIPRIKGKIHALENELEFAEKIARRKELSRDEKSDVDNIPAIRKRLGILKKLLESKAEELESKLKRKKLYGKSRLVGEIKDIEAFDKGQDDRISLIKKETEDLNRVIPAVIEEINALESRIKGMSGRLGSRVGAVELRLDRPDFYKKRKLFEHDAQKHFEDYEGGVRRLHALENELNSLDTRKFKKQEKEIRRKLKDVALVPEIEHGIQELKLRIAGVDVDYQKSLIDEKQDRIIRGVPKLRREITAVEYELQRTKSLARKKELTKAELKEIQKLPYLEAKLGRLSFEERRLAEEEQRLEKGFEELPVIKRKTWSLGRLFRREKDEIKQLEDKVDNYRLKFYDQLNQELAESRKLIEEEKFELKKQLLDLLAESIKNLNKEKDESNKKILEEIKRVEGKMETEKEDINKSVVSKIVQLRSRLDKGKEELEEETEERINTLKKRFEEADKNARPVWMRKFAEREAEEFGDKGEREEKEEGEIEGIEEQPGEKRKKGKEKGKMEKMKMPRFEFVKKIPNLPEFPEKPRQAIFARQEARETSEMSFPAFPEMPRAVELGELSQIKTKIRPGKFAVELGETKKRTPKHTFLDYGAFARLAESIRGIKKISDSEFKSITKSLSQAAETKKEIAISFENFGKIKENISKVNRALF